MKKLVKVMFFTLVAVVICLAFSACLKEEHVHVLTHIEAVTPKCNAEGNVEYWMCNDCNKKFLDKSAKKEAVKQSDIILEMTECNYRGCVCVDCGNGEHSLRHYPEIAAACEEIGRVEHWRCLVCEYRFLDEAAKNEVSEIIIPAAHSGGTVIRDKVAPTEDKAGYSGNTYCLGCGTIIAMGEKVEMLDHTHVLTHHGRVESGCFTDGSIEYWSCSVCLKNYMDAETTVEADSIVIKATHVLQKIEAKPSTCNTQGNIEYFECTRCENYYSDSAGKIQVYPKNSVKLNYTLCKYEDSICVWCGEVQSWNRLALQVVNDEYLVVTGFEEYSDTDIVIESSYGGLPVKEIADGAFSYDTTITSIILPEGLVKIGKNAFAGCSALISVTLPKSLVYIEDNAFAGCLKLFEVINRSSLKLKQGAEGYGMVAYYARLIHNGASRILRSGDFLFAPHGNELYLLGYKGTKVVLELPKTYNGAAYKIYSFAFAGRSDIVSITVPYKVIEIGNNAFDGCTRLAEVINKSQMPISKGSGEYGGVAMYALEVHNGVSKVTERDGYLFYTSGSGVYLVAYTGKSTTLTLPDSFDGSSYIVKAQAFSNMNKLKSVKTGGASELEDMAFFGCTSLKSVEFSSSLKKIGSAAFQCCSALESVTVNGRLVYIGENAFYMCPNLKKVPTV